MSKRTRILTRKGYINYLNAYNKKKEVLSHMGSEMQSPELSYVQWQYTYENTRNDLLNEIKEGRRKVVGNVNQYIISQQAYEFNYKQARAMKIAAEKTGQTLSINKIRTGQFDWTQISDTYKGLKEEGLRGKDAQEYISWFFFGSE